MKLIILLLIDGVSLLFLRSGHDGRDNDKHYTALDERVKSRIERLAHVWSASEHKTGLFHMAKYMPWVEDKPLEIEYDCRNKKVKLSHHLGRPGLQALKRELKESGYEDWKIKNPLGMGIMGSIICMFILAGLWIAVDYLDNSKFDFSPIGENDASAYYLEHCGNHCSDKVAEKVAVLGNIKFKYWRNAGGLGLDTYEKAFLHYLGTISVEEQLDLAEKCILDRKLDWSKLEEILLQDAPEIKGGFERHQEMVKKALVVDKLIGYPINCAEEIELTENPGDCHLWARPTIKIDESRLDESGFDDLVLALLHEDRHCEQDKEYGHKFMSIRENCDIIEGEAMDREKKVADRLGIYRDFEQHKRDAIEVCRKLRETEECKLYKKLANDACIAGRKEDCRQYREKMMDVCGF